MYDSYGSVNYNFAGKSFEHIPVKTQDYLAPVVRKVDSAVNWINYYPLDSAIVCRNTYPLDSDLSGG